MRCCSGPPPRLALRAEHSCSPPPSPPLHRQCSMSSLRQWRVSNVSAAMRGRTAAPSVSTTLRHSLARPTLQGIRRSIPRQTPSGGPGSHHAGARRCAPYPAEGGSATVRAAAAPHVHPGARRAAQTAARVPRLGPPEAIGVAVARRGKSDTRMDRCATRRARQS